MKKKHMIVFVFILSIVILTIFGVHLTSTLSVHGKYGTDAYAIEHSEVKSEEFIGDNFSGYTFYYQRSNDIDRDNEIHIFVNADNAFFSLFGLTERYKHYISTTSDKSVGSLCFSMPTRRDKEDINTVILYFSNNKDKITECVYQFEINGEITEIKEKIQPNYGFNVLIPYITNHKGTIKDLKKVSFYDETGTLVFEDLPKVLEQEYR